ASKGTLSIILCANCRPVYSHGVKQKSISNGEFAGFHWGQSVVVAIEDNKELAGTYGNITEFWFELAWPLVISLPMTIVFGVKAGKRLMVRRKQGMNICAICGYDLRATPERCPECGTARPG